mmetsp:Transcript_5670/g.8762  ORF Transcript_5670/g.8762 Transcript_5670/m.8762 type:complete len:90 (+) Transcript_5670:52-321(+)
MHARIILRVQLFVKLETRRRSCNKLFLSPMYENDPSHLPSRQQQVIHACSMPNPIIRTMRASDRLCFDMRRISGKGQGTSKIQVFVFEE